MKNELLKIWEEALGMTWEDWQVQSRFDRDMVGWNRFDTAVTQVKESGITKQQLLSMSAMSTYTDERRHIYSWAVPTPEAIQFIAKFTPIVEIGAGTGYWANLLRQEGALVFAYDRNPPDGSNDNHWHRGATTWTQVTEGGPEKVKLHPDATLFLCWPPMNRMAYDSLWKYEGDRVIYIGEPEDGATANDKFFDLLKKDWNCIHTMTIPQWLGLHDYLFVYERLT